MNPSPKFAWKAQPIFISSTFTDMMAERDALMHYVFPELAERLRERRIHLEPIDLRWGVETTDKKEQMEKELLVLKVCLDEIDRCKPFLIGMIGDRYGWVPPEERMKAAEEEKGFKSVHRNKSITALEIEYGVLSNNAQLKRSRFYFREPLDYNKMSEEMAKEFSDMHNPEIEKGFAEKRLSDYKSEITAKVGRDKVKYYKGLEDFKKLVLEDLWEELDAETKAIENKRPATWQEEERLFLEEFIEERTIGFSGREDVINYLKKFALSAPDYDDCALCLTGESGSGKSAIFAKLHKELQKEDVFILAHAAGISLRSNSLENMLLLWIEELADYLKTDVSGQLKEKNRFDDLTKLFAELLSRASADNRVVVLVDALNQFERTVQAKYVNWLPELLLENVKFIFTVIPGEETEHLSKRKGIKVEKLNPVTKTDAEEIINTICRRYHKTLNHEVKEIVLNNKNADGVYAYSNPLWLNMAVDEFLLLDEDDFTGMKGETGTPEEKLRKLLVKTAKEMPAGVEGMYGYLFNKTGERFGKEFVNALLSFITVTRYGLRESDLEKLIRDYAKQKWDNLNFAALRRYLRSHIVKKGEEGLWDFRHVQVRIGINNSLLKENEQKKHYHKLISGYLETLADNDSLRMTEIMWHLFKCDDKEKTAKIYGSYWLDTEQTKEHSITLKDILLESGVNVKWVSELPAIEDVDENVKMYINNNFLFSLDVQLKDYVKLGERKDIILSVLKSTQDLSSRNPDSAEYARDLSVSYNNVGDINKSLGDTKSALKSYESSLNIREELRRRNPDSAEYARDLSISYERIGDINKSLGDTKSALKSYESSLNIREELRRRNPDSAEYARDLSVSYNKVGDIYKALGDTKSALKSYEDGFKIFEELRRRNPDSAEYARDLYVSCWRMADINEQLGNGSSKEWWRRAYETLNKMKSDGLFISKEDEKFLEILRKKVQN